MGCGTVGQREGCNRSPRLRKCWRWALLGIAHARQLPRQAKKLSGEKLHMLVQHNDPRTRITPGPHLVERLEPLRMRQPAR